MAASFEDAEHLGDELLAAIGFIDEFPYPPPSPSVATLTERAYRDGNHAHASIPQRHVVTEMTVPHSAVHSIAVAPSLAPLGDLSSEEIDELSSLVQSDSAILLSELQRPHEHDGRVQERPVSVAIQPSKKKVKKTTWDSNKARKERREELVYLRRMVLDLEVQLAELQAKTPSSIIAPRRYHCARTTTTRRTPAPTEGKPKKRVWEQVAKNQWVMREKAERENIRLKLVLQSQLKITGSLEKHLGRATSTNEIERCFAANQIRDMYPPVRRDADSVIYNGLLVGVEQSYAELNAVFEANGFATATATDSHLSAQMRSSGSSDSVSLEIFATKLLPFDYDATVETVWDHFVFVKERLPTRIYYNKSPKVFLRQTSSYIKGRWANFGVKQVIRRYEEQDRVVIVWQSSVDQITFSGEPLHGVRFLEKGYVVIKKPIADSNDAFTMVQPCYVITPIFSEQYVEGNHPQVNSMTDFELTTTTTNINTSNQTIEDVLLQQAMASRNGDGGASEGNSSTFVSV